MVGCPGGDAAALVAKGAHKAREQRVVVVCGEHAGNAVLDHAGQAGVVDRAHAQPGGHRLDVGQALRLAARRADEHVAHGVVAVDGFPRLGPGEGDVLPHAQRLRLLAQLARQRPLAHEHQPHVRAGFKQPGEDAHHALEVLFPGDAPDVQQHALARLHAALSARGGDLPGAVARGGEARNVHAAGDHVDGGGHAVAVQKVQRLDRRGDDPVKPVAPPLRVFARDGAGRLVRVAVGDIIGIVLPHGVVGVHQRAARAPGDVAAEVAHDELAVGVHHVKPQLLRLPGDREGGEGDVAVLQGEERRGGEVVDVPALVFLPAPALGRKDVHLVAAAGELLLQRQAGGGHPVDFGVKGIRKKADLHAVVSLSLWRVSGRRCPERISARGTQSGRQSDEISIA